MMTAPEHWDIPHEEEPHKPAVIRRLGPKPKMPPIRARGPEHVPVTHVVPTWFEMHDERGDLLDADIHSRPLYGKPAHWDQSVRDPQRDEGSPDRPVGSRTRWTAERLDDLRERLQGDVTLEELAPIYGVGIDAVSKAIRRMGLKPPKRSRHRAAYKPWSDEERATAKEMIAQGRDLREIADQIGRNERSIYSMLYYDNKVKAPKR